MHERQFVNYLTILFNDRKRLRDDIYMVLDSPLAYKLPPKADFFKETRTTRKLEKFRNQYTVEDIQCHSKVAVEQ